MVTCKHIRNFLIIVDEYMTLKNAILATKNYSGETGWPSKLGLSPFGLRAKTGWASLAHIFSGQLLTSTAGPDAGCGLKRVKMSQNLKNVKTWNLSNFIIFQIKKNKTQVVNNS